MLHPCKRIICCYIRNIFFSLVDSLCHRLGIYFESLKFRNPCCILSCQNRCLPAKKKNQLINPLSTWNLCVLKTVNAPSCWCLESLAQMIAARFFDLFVICGINWSWIDSYPMQHTNSLNRIMMRSYCYFARHYARGEYKVRKKIQLFTLPSFKFYTNVWSFVCRIGWIYLKEIERQTYLVSLYVSRTLGFYQFIFFFCWN